MIAIPGMSNAPVWLWLVLAFAWNTREKQKHGASSTVTESTFFWVLAKSQSYRVQNQALEFALKGISYKPQLCDFSYTDSAKNTKRSPTARVASNALRRRVKNGGARAKNFVWRSSLVSL
jgi:hypothetical protein